MVAPTDREPLVLVDHYLREQAQLTAVDQFAHAHAATEGLARAGHYSTLMPASPPAEGQQYAFEVDLDACSGCKSCVVACHTLNGLEEDESWRDVGKAALMQEKCPLRLVAICMSQSGSIILTTKSCRSCQRTSAS